MQKVLGFLLVVGLCSVSVLARTSLELAFFAAFNQKIQDGTWANVIGYPHSGLYGGNLCMGDISNAAFPKVESGSDLDYVLKSGVFTCGFPKDIVQYTVDGQVLIDTTGPVARGKIVDLYFYLGISISSYYGPQVNVTWNTNFSSTTDVLNGVLNGTFDAACGAFSPGATFVYEGETVPRSYFMSLFQCFTYFQTPLITTLSDSDVSSFDDVIASIEAADQSGTTFRVCTTGSLEGGVTQICTGTFIQYVPGYECTGLGTRAYSDLNSGFCDAVWGSPPLGSPTDQNQHYVTFIAPTMASEGSFFRSEDFHSSSSTLVSTLFAFAFLWVLF